MHQPDYTPSSISNHNNHLQFHKSKKERINRKKLCCSVTFFKKTCVKNQKMYIKGSEKKVFKKLRPINAKFFKKLGDEGRKSIKNAFDSLQGINKNFNFLNNVLKAIFFFIMFKLKNKLKVRWTFMQQITTVSARHTSKKMKLKKFQENAKLWCKKLKLFFHQDECHNSSTKLINLTNIAMQAQHKKSFRLSYFLQSCKMLITQSLTFLQTELLENNHTAY